jgi:5'-3' exonuclease
MNLIIDGNAFLNVVLNVTRASVRNDLRVGNVYWVSNLIEDRFELKSQVKDSFKNIIFTYLNSIVNMFPNNLEIHWVFDSKNWRYTYLEEFGVVYKDRKEKDTYEYLFFEYFNTNLKPYFEKIGINFYKHLGMEGDDLIAWLSESLDGDSLIYTVDSDLKQLVSGNNKNIFIIFPKRGKKEKTLIVPLDIYYPVLQKEEDFFDLSESLIEEPNISKLIKNFENKKYTICSLDNNFELLNKILLGDTSDKIKKIPRLNIEKSNLIISDFLIQFPKFNSKDLLNIEVFEKLYSLILNHLKPKNNLDKIRDTLRLNIKLICLGSYFLPEDLYENVEEYFNTFSIKKFKRSEFTNLKNNIYTL